MTLVSRVLGLLRDAACSAVYGAGGVWSAFAIAFQIPNLFRRLFGEGALSAAFIPVFSEKLHRCGETEARDAADKVLGLQLALLGVVVLLGEAALAVLWVFDAESARDRLTILLTAAMLPYVVLICGTALLGGMLNVLRVFSIPAAAPIVLNLCILAAVFFAWRSARDGGASIWPVAIAVLIAGLLQVAMQYSVLLRRRMAVRPKLAWKDPVVKAVLSLFLPTVAGLAAVQVNTLADSLIAYWLVPREGAPAVLYYAQRLYQFPLGVVAISAATAIFEQMSAQAAMRQYDRVGHSAEIGIRLMLFLGLPAGAGLVLVAEPLVGAIFQRGAFGPADTRLVAGALACYSLGVWAYMSGHILIRGFYALQRPRTPARIALAAVAANLALNLALVGPLAERGLALATSLTAMMQVALLGWFWQRQVGGVAWKKVFVTGLKAMLATAAMCAAVILAGNLAAAGGTLVRLAAMVVCGAAVFVAVAIVLKAEEIGMLLSRRPSE